MQLTPNLHAFLWNSANANNCNTYLIAADGTNILIDPGHAPFFDHVRRGLGERGLTVEDVNLVICTHAHSDHSEAIRFFEKTRSLFAIHPGAWNLIKNRAPYDNGVLIPELNGIVPDFFLTEGELKVGSIVLEVFHTPGHSPGSVSLFWRTAGALFTGDLIFKDGLGRTDLPGGNGAQLKASIRRMGTLNAQWLLSGHGQPVSGAAEVKANFARVERQWFGYV